MSSYQELCIQDSLSDGYLSGVTKTAVENHVHKYLGFEINQPFFDSAFLCNYPKTVEMFFNLNKDGFVYTIDTRNSVIQVSFQGEPFLTVDVSRYNCENLCCLYRNKVLLYDEKGIVIMDDTIISSVKHELKSVERTFLERGYLCDSILDVDISYPLSLLCDIKCSGESTFRCFFDTISLSPNDYIETLCDSLRSCLTHYGLSRIVFNSLILYPAQ